MILVPLHTYEARRFRIHCGVGYPLSATLSEADGFANVLVASTRKEPRGQSRARPAGRRSQTAGPGPSPGLEEEGFAVDVANDGEEGDYKARTAEYDVIILDLMLPKEDGLSLLKNWRRAGLKTHVLVLTARGTIEDKVKGLDSGRRRLPDQAVRAGGAAGPAAGPDPPRPPGQGSRSCASHDLEIDTAARTVKRGGQAIHLTPREYALLQFLAFHRGKVVTRSMIWEHLYDEHDENTSNVVDVYIRYLRNKIDKGFEPPLILTRWGEGYMLRGGRRMRSIRGPV